MTPRPLLNRHYYGHRRLLGRGESIDRVRKSSEPRAMVRDPRQFVVLPSGPLILVSLPPAQGPHGHHCLDSVAHPELSENCGDVVFHRRLDED